MLIEEARVGAGSTWRESLIRGGMKHNTSTQNRNKNSGTQYANVNIKITRPDLSHELGKTYKPIFKDIHEISYIEEQHTCCSLVAVLLQISTIEVLGPFAPDFYSRQPDSWAAPWSRRSRSSRNQVFWEFRMPAICCMQTSY